MALSGRRELPSYLSHPRVTSDPSPSIYGITVLQTYTYFRRYSKDSLTLKALVRIVDSVLYYLETERVSNQVGALLCVEGL